MKRRFALTLRAALCTALIGGSVFLPSVAIADEGDDASSSESATQQEAPAQNGGTTNPPDPSDKTTEEQPAAEEATAPPAKSETSTTEQESSPQIAAVVDTIVMSDPAITGDARLGETLTAVPGEINVEGTGLSYAWTSGSSAVGTDRSTYVADAGDVGRAITVTITATKDGFDAVSATSAPTASVAEGQFTQTGPEPQITGETIVGQTLSYADPALDPAPDTVSYNWLRDGATIAGATGNTYTLTAGDLGARISLVSSHSADGYETLALTTEPTDVVSYGPFTMAQPTISGDAQVGRTLTATPGAVSPEPDSLAHTWRAGGDVVGTDSTTYVPQPADVGKAITVTVAAERTNFDSTSSTSEPTAPVVEGEIAVESYTAEIFGIPAVGAELAFDGDVNGVRPNGATTSYRWLRDGVPIDGATGPRYTLTSEDARKPITAVWVFSSPGYADLELRTEPTSAVVGGPIIMGTPTIDGDARVGTALTATPGKTDPAGAAHSFVWKADGVVVGTDSNTYTPVVADLGKTVAVTVTASQNGWDSTSATSEPTAPVALGEFSYESATLDITGAPAVGEQLILSARVDAHPAYNTKLQWFRDGVPIDGATGSRYIVTGDDARTLLSATLTLSRPGYRDLVFTSDPTDPVIGGPFTMDAPTISGEPQVDGPLTATPGATEIDGVTFSYAWQAGGEPVGTDSSTYTPTADDLEKIITVTVTASKQYYDDNTDTSEPTGPVAPGEFEFISAEGEINGTPAVGETVTFDAEVTGLDPDEDSSSFQWFRDGEPIDGATGSDYTATRDDARQQLTVTWTFHRAGYEDVVFTSEPTDPVIGGPFTMDTPTISGEPRVGEPLTATPGEIEIDNTTLGYAWQAGGEPVGTDSPTYTPTADDLDKTITVTVTASKQYYDDNTASSEPTGAVAIGEFTYSDFSITADGDPLVGRSLRADVEISDLSPEYDSRSVRWLRDGVPVTGATSEEYLLTNADAAATLTPVVTLHKDGYADLELVGTPSAMITGGLFTHSRPRIAGDPRVDGLLTATPGGIEPDASFIVFAWRADGGPVGGNAATYRPAAADVGKNVTVTVTANRFAFDASARTSVPSPAVARAVFSRPPAVFISGVSKVGERLTTSVDGSAPAAAVSLQWLASGRPIGGATGSSYVPNASERGKTIRVQVTARRAGYIDVVRISSATGPVATDQAPSFSRFDASPTSVAPGQSIRLSWSSRDAESLRASGDWSGRLATSGSRTVEFATPGRQMFLISATNENGTTTAQESVLVREPPGQGPPAQTQAPALPPVELIPPAVDGSDVSTVAAALAAPAGFTAPGTIGVVGDIGNLLDRPDPGDVAIGNAPETRVQTEDDETGGTAIDSSIWPEGVDGFEAILIAFVIGAILGAGAFGWLVIRPRT